MNIDNINKVYFIGIGGIGMSSLARYFKSIGKEVAGYDKTPTSLTTALEEEGIKIHFTDNVENISKTFKKNEETLIVFSPAVPKSNNELQFFVKNNFQIKKRAEVLGLITNNKKSIAVAGTHGKTTTSTLIAHILKCANLEPSAFLGGISQNYESNILIGNNPDGYVVVEADEYDRSFLNLHPTFAVITSVDADHLDIYGDLNYLYESYSLFANQVSSTLTINNSVVGKINQPNNSCVYGTFNGTSNYFAQNITVSEAEYHYEVVTPSKTIKNLTLGLPGDHNVENSIAAIAIAEQLNIPEEIIRTSLKSFTGVKRRFEYQIKTDRLVYIDDYAHHPSELKACINSIKKMYPNKKITGIFQPHLFTRTRDFANEFANSLDLLDECFLMDIYPARELPIEGVNATMLLNKMKLERKKHCKFNTVLDEINSDDIDVLLTLGAGDIDTLVQPIKDKLLNGIKN